MGDSAELSDGAGGRVTEIHPLAFTIEFGDQKFDESRKSKVQERLSAFKLKHRRNPSLPEFRAKSSPPGDKLLLPSQHVPITSNREKPEYQWKSSALREAENIQPKTYSFRGSIGMKESFLKNLKIGRRLSLDGMTDKIPDDDIVKNGVSENIENESDTVSEAGTYTVDKEEEEEGESNENGQEENEPKTYQRTRVNDWVREQQSLCSPASKELTHSKSLENGNGLPSKIPSPINTLTKKAKPRKTIEGIKLNGSALHRKSSSLSAKDYNENQGSESSLETESYLRTTESVVAALQNRMKSSFEKKNPDLRTPKKNFSYKERPHPPSTASDTDTNSEIDDKTFKKPIGNPFTSARLNRAFSLRRAKADPDKDATKKKSANDSGILAKIAAPMKVVTSKPPSSTPFSRLDCGRFSMRTTPSTFRANQTGQPGQPGQPGQLQRKETKKPETRNRSTSSLSSREVEFQNWRRRKNFDPMKAAAEGRKKELAKKVAMTQSVNLGNAVRPRSGGGTTVLRSASFHSAAEVFGGDDDDGDEFRGSADEHEEMASSPLLSNRRSLTHNSPNQACCHCQLVSRNPVFNSRGSLVSETHSSPGRRLRSNELESLVLSAISDASHKLRFKSCKLLKKLKYHYDPREEKSSKLRDEIAVLESQLNSAKSSPIHQTTSRDLSTILKNLKAIENVFTVLDDILFEENLEIYLDE